MEKLYVKENVVSKNIMKMTIAEESKHEYKRLWVYARYGNGK